MRGYRIPSNRSKPPENSLSDDVKAKLRAALDAGYSTVVAARIVGISASCALRYRDAWGIPRRAPHEYTPAPPTARGPTKLPAVTAGDRCDSCGARLSDYDFATDSVGRVFLDCSSCGTSHRPGAA